MPHLVAMTTCSTTESRGLPSSFNYLAPLPLAAALLALAGCAQTTHPVVSAAPLDPPAPSTFASRSVSSFAEFAGRLDEPGPIVFEKYVAADWVIERKGLINLDHEHAEHLKNGPEQIQIYFYHLAHPEHGDFMIDSGVASVFRTEKNLPVRFPVSSVMPLDTLEIHLDTKTFLDQRDGPLSGAFLTHLHLDHIMGLCDLPRDVPLYVGPGEAEDSRVMHALMRSTTNLNLRGFGPLRAFETVEEEGAPFRYVDIFSDGSVLGLHVPGHTKGSMAFALRTTRGPVLVVGDASHTAWGWEHSVEPGTFNTDTQSAATSLDKLLAFAEQHPTMVVHLGHQALD